MIFNRYWKGAEELRKLTGNYYANNDFEKIESDIKQATDDLCLLIGDKVFDKALKEYSSGDENDKELVELVQRPIAIMATLRMYRKNDVSHEDSGRKIKLASDNTEKIPWEWQLDRDDAIHLEEYYQAVERLIRYLDKKNLEEWIGSDTKKVIGTLLIRSGRSFDTYFPIQSSERMYLLIVGFIREVQIRYIQPAYGATWAKLLVDSSIPESEVHFAACKATALLAMSMAFRRMPLQLIPSGIIRGYLAENGAVKSTPATVDEVRKIASWLECDAKDWINRMKVLRDGDTGEPEILPNNSPRNKFFRL